MNLTPLLTPDPLATLDPAALSSPRPSPAQVAALVEAASARVAGRAS